MLNIYYGRENLDKEKFIFDRIKGKTVVLVPDQFTLDFERDLFSYLAKDALMDIEVLSMSRLRTRLLEETGGSKRKFIDEYGRFMLLLEIALKEGKNLTCFKGLEEKTSFIDSVNDCISEFKNNGLTCEELKELSLEVKDDKYLSSKLEDLYLLYSKYEEKIKGKYTDVEDLADIFVKKISESKFVKETTFFIYSFDSFAPKAISVITELSRYAKDVNLILTYDDKGKDKDLFTLTNVIISTLSDLVPVTKERIDDGYIREKANDISVLEEELYKVPNSYIGKTDDSIKVVSSSNLYSEAETCANYVLHLIRDKGLKLSEIRIICNDIDTRTPILKRMFNEYGLTIFSDESKEILASPILQFILSLSEIVLLNYDTTSIFKMLKSGFTDLTTDEILDLENYAIKYRIKGNSWKKSFTKGIEEYGDDELLRLEDLRKRVYEYILPYIEMAKSSKTKEEYIDGLYKYIYEDIDLPSRIHNLIDEAIEKERIDLADYLKEVFDSLISVLDQLKELVGKEKFDLKLFSKLLEVGLKKVKIGALPPTVDGLTLGNIERTRLNNSIKALVVVGLNEGILPKEEKSKGIFLNDEKELFSKKGINFMRTDSVKLMEERLAIYRNLVKPTDYLYLSYSNSDVNGDTIRPSSVIAKVIDIFGKDILESDSKIELNSSVSGLRHLTNALNDYANGSDLDDRYSMMISWLKEKKKEDISILEKGFSFTNKEENIGNEFANRLYKKDLEGALSLSPSRLERFSRCPFEHFIIYGLKPEERRVFEVAPREIGDIYHECLMELAKELTVEGLPLNDPKSPWVTVGFEEIKAIIDKTVDKKTESYKEGLFKEGNSEKYRISRIKENIYLVSKNIVNQVRSGEILSSKYEESFNRARGIKPIEVLVNGEKVFIEGKIDRVDILKGDKVKIVDYKTGNEKFSTSEARNGYRLQLMLYLRAAKEEKRKPAGVFYFHIDEPLIDVTGEDLKEFDLDSKLKKEFKLNGLIVDDMDTIKSVAGDFTGYSDILPLRITKDGNVTGTVDSLLSVEEFEKLERDVEAKVNELVTNLKSGDISIYPMKTKNISECAYCKVKSICGFDTEFIGNKYHIIKED